MHSLARFVFFVCLAAVSLASAQSGKDKADASWSTANNDATRRRVAGLIEQLAAPEYITRRTAQIELTRIGLPAFDQVLAATESPDPEVAASSSYLLSKLAVEWVSLDDPPLIRDSLSNYGSLNEPERLAVVSRLARQVDDTTATSQGALTALCRIVRFDPSHAVSRRAAGEVVSCEELQPPEERFTVVRRAQQQLNQRYGSSRRTTSSWVDRFMEQSTLEPQAALEAWRVLVAREQQQSKGEQIASHFQPPESLDWNLLRLQLAAEDEASPETAHRVVNRAGQSSGPSGSEAAIAQVFDWLLASQAEQAIDEVIENLSEQMASKRGRYVLATVRARQGNQPEAEQLAQAARETPYPLQIRLAGGRALDGRIGIANRLRLDGYLEWANHEYVDVVADGEPLSASAVYASTRRCDMLQDAERYEEAVAGLQQLSEQINVDAESKKKYSRLYDKWREPDIKSTSQVESNRHYCQALAHRKAGNEQQARDSLDRAIAEQPGDADILIAMYRSTGASAIYREETIDRIRELAKKFENQIEIDPSDPDPLNQWAWLISNTQGDYERAIEYSLRSLEIYRRQTGAVSEGYLDTLGRCFFAAGRYQDAIKVQRQAVQMSPFILVMQRQLTEFEAALAKVEGGEGQAE